MAKDKIEENTEEKHLMIQSSNSILGKIKNLIEKFKNIFTKKQQEEIVKENSIKEEMKEEKSLKFIQDLKIKDNTELKAIMTQLENNEILPYSLSIEQIKEIQKIYIKEIEQQKVKIRELELKIN